MRTPWVADGPAALPSPDQRLRSLPARGAYMPPLCREGRLVSLELPGLPAKDAYCLVCLPAIQQHHVLSLIPTGIVLCTAAAQLGAGAWPPAAIGWAGSALA